MPTMTALLTIVSVLQACHVATATTMVVRTIWILTTTTTGFLPVAKALKRTPMAMVSKTISIMTMMVMASSHAMKMRIQTLMAMRRRTLGRMLIAMAFPRISILMTAKPE